jgi:CspA family cold shock protein
MAQYTGTVKWYNDTKGYGFIAPEQGGGDVFVHVTALKSAKVATLRENQRVAYNLETNNKGKTSAIDLTVLDD